MTTFKTDLIKPTVNLNGTSRETLIANLVGVIRALRATDEALALAMPHGRDYQNSRIDGQNLSYIARDAVIERRQVIIDMRKEFEKQAETLATEKHNEYGSSISGPNVIGTRCIGTKQIAIIGMLEPGAEVLRRRDLDPEPGKVKAEIVLCYVPDNEVTPLVTWQRNTDDFVGTYWGHYYTADDFDEAVRDFETRGGRLIHQTWAR